MSNRKIPYQTIMPASGGDRFLYALSGCTIKNHKECLKMIENPQEYTLNLDGHSFKGWTSTHPWWSIAIQSPAFQSLMKPQNTLFNRRHSRSINILSQLPKSKSIRSFVREVRGLPPRLTLDIFSKWVHETGGFEQCPVPFAQYFAPLFLFYNFKKIEPGANSLDRTAISVLSTYGQDWALLHKLSKKKPEIIKFVHSNDDLSRSVLMLDANIKENHSSLRRTV
jgi:hypothetical protein